MISVPVPQAHVSINGFTTGPLRDVALPVAAVLATLMLPFQWVLYAYLVIGHAHFLMAYLYQYRGKRMGRVYGIVALLLLVASVAYFILTEQVQPILVVSGILFALHFALDELTLHGEAFTATKGISVAGFTLLFSSLILTMALHTISWLPLLAGALLLCGALLRVLFAHEPLSSGEAYLLMVGFLLFVLSVGFHRPESILGVILLLHFFNWYIGFGVRLSGNRAKAASYWKEVAVTLVVVLVLFVLYHLWLPALALFFGLAYYYAWAIAHILLSFVSTPRR